MITQHIRRAPALLFILLFASAAFAQFSFTAATYGSPNQPTDVFVADLNNDHFPDIITTQSESNAITVFLNHGDGTFTSNGSAMYLTGQHPIRVVAADFNGDGKLDLATANDCPQNGVAGSISILFGNGDGTFQPATTISLPNQECPNSLALTKVNSSHWDLAAATNLGNIELLLNNGAGVFSFGTPIVSPGGPEIRGVSSADYNGDGHFDLAAVTEGRSDSIYIFLNDGAGHYTPQFITDAATAIGDSTFTFEATNTVDIFGDGIARLLVPFSPPAGGSPDVGHGAGVLVLFNNGKAQFSSEAIRNLSGPPFNKAGWKAAERDLNADGLHDIVLPVHSNSGADAFLVFPADSRTSWGAPQTFTTGANTNPVAAATGDFRNDGRTGFGGVTQTDSTLHVYLNNSGPIADCLPPRRGIGICSPGSSSKSPVPVAVSVNGFDHNIVFTRAFIDGNEVADSSDGNISANVLEVNGEHLLSIDAIDDAGQHLQTAWSFTVAPNGGQCAAHGAGIQICSPSFTSANSSPVRILGDASSDAVPIVEIKAYIDGRLVASIANSNELDASVPVAPGQHQLAFNAWDRNGRLFQDVANFFVSGGGGGGSCAVPSTAGVHVCSPAAGSTVSSPVAISASSNGGTRPITAMKAYIDGKQVAASSSNTLSASVPAAAGTHTLNVNAWNSAGQVFTSQETFTVH